MIPPLTCKPAPSEFEKFDDFFPNRYQSQILQTFEKVPLFNSQSPPCRTPKPFRNLTVTFIPERVYFVWRDASHPRNTLTLALNMICSHPIGTDEPIPRIQKAHIFLTQENLPSKSNCQRSFCKIILFGTTNRQRSELQFIFLAGFDLLDPMLV